MAYPNPFGLAIRTVPQGRDYVWLVTGGEAHVGAVAVAYWHGGEEECDGAGQGHVQGEGQGQRKIRAEVITVPSHKEGELARELAELACLRLKATVTVACGIHIDRATAEEIGHIVEEVRRLALEELDVIIGNRFS